MCCDFCICTICNSRVLLVSIGGIQTEPCCIIPVYEALISSIFQLNVVEPFVNGGTPVCINIKANIEAFPCSLTFNIYWLLSSIFLQISFFCSHYRQLHYCSIAEFCGILLLERSSLIRWYVTRGPLFRLPSNVATPVRRQASAPTRLSRTN